MAGKYIQLAQTFSSQRRETEWKIVLAPPKKSKLIARSISINIYFLTWSQVCANLDLFVLPSTTSATIHNFECRAIKLAAVQCNELGCQDYPEEMLLHLDTVRIQ